MSTESNVEAPETVTVEVTLDGKSLSVGCRPYWMNLSRAEAMELLAKLPAEIAKLPVKLP